MRKATIPNYGTNVINFNYGHSSPAAFWALETLASFIESALKNQNIDFELRDVEPHEDGGIRFSIFLNEIEIGPVFPSPGIYDD